MKGHPIKTIINIGVNVSIVTYPIVKRFQLAIGPADGSQIIAIDQQRKTVKGVVEVNMTQIDETQAKDRLQQA